VQDVCELMAARAAAKGLPMTVDFEPALPGRVVGDVLRLQQVLHNLLGNAIKFTRSGRVALTVRRDAARETLRFDVTDTGIGIAAERAAHLFDRFVQADGSIARQFGGTGLGLAIARELVELMGGRIEVQSTLGAGAAFWFTARLPEAAPAEPGSAVPARQRELLARVLDAEPGAREPAPPPLCAALARPVLLVEDNPVNALYAEAVLQSRGLRVVIAGDGAEAVDAVRASPFALILMDCHMPGLDGWTATARIRALERELGRAHTPIVALSASAMAEERERCVEAGMDDFLAKPFRAEELHACIGRWLREAAAA